MERPGGGPRGEAIEVLLDGTNGYVGIEGTFVVVVRVYQTAFCSCRPRRKLGSYLPTTTVVLPQSAHATTAAVGGLGVTKMELLLWCVAHEEGEGGGCKVWRGRDGGWLPVN